MDGFGPGNGRFVSGSCPTNGALYVRFRCFKPKTCQSEIGPFSDERRDLPPTTAFRIVQGSLEWLRWGGERTLRVFEVHRLRLPMLFVGLDALAHHFQHLWYEADQGEVVRVIGPL